MSPPDLTVVVPVWGDYARYLPELRRRLRAQDVADTQVLLVVNADPALAARAGTLWPDAHVLVLPSRVTVGAARTAALAHVRSDLVCFCDADDLPAPGALPRLCAVLRARPGTVLATGLAERLTERGTEPYPWPPASAARPMSRFRRVARQWAFNHLSLTTGALLRTDAVRAAGGFPDADLAEDGMLACFLTALGEVIVLDEATRQYRTHPDGLCQRGHSARRWREAYRQQRRWLAAHPALGPWRHAARLYAPAHWKLSRRLAAVARHDH